MIIGIDISQIVYEGTGVARYVEEMVKNIISGDSSNTYILFGSSFRRQQYFSSFITSLPEDVQNRVILRKFPIPPMLLDFFWNKLALFPIEWFIGHVDVFWSSDWTQPPLSSAKGVTTIHDLSIYRFPQSFDQKIVTVHKRKLSRSIAFCSAFLCDSEATRQDAITVLHIPEHKLHVVYPGYQL